MAKQRLKLMKKLLMVHYYFFPPPENGVQFNDSWWNCTSRENCQRKSQYCSDPLGSDHLRRAEKVCCMKLPYLWYSQKVLVALRARSAIYVSRLIWENPKQCTEISIPKIHTNGIIRMKHLQFSSVQFSSPSSSLRVAPLQFSSVWFHCCNLKYPQGHHKQTPHTRTTKMWILQLRSKNIGFLCP